MRSRERLIRSLCAGLGLEVVELGFGGHGHYIVSLRNSAGLVRKFSFSNTPSDKRGDLNKVSVIRRYFNEVQHEQRSANPG